MGWKRDTDGAMRATESSRTKLKYENQEELATEAASFLASYRPKDIDEKLWADSLGEFVRKHVAGLDVPFEVLRRYVRVLSYLGNFCVAQGMPLDIEMVLDPDTVERFARSMGDKKAATRATYRAALRALGPALTRTAPWEPCGPAYRKTELLPPYSASEERALRRDMVNQVTPALTQSSIAIISLGMGAGLDGRWIPSIRGTDVRQEGDFVVVVVPEPSTRIVVVRKAWEVDLLGLADRAGTHTLLKTTSDRSNTVSNITARMVIDQGRVKVQARRLRSTWLLSLLESRLPLPELLQASGIKGSKSLIDLVPYMTKFGDEATSRLLREA